MCIYNGAGVSTPAKRLADLMAKEMGLSVDEHLLRLFIISKWDRVTVLAHAIHDAEEKR